MKEYVHRPYQKGETIAAIATPPGEGGVAIIRVSGLKALDVVEICFSGPLRSYKSHTAHCGKILDKNGKQIDECLLISMLTPRSYTGEDTVEIHCHGGSLVTRAVLDRVLECGARAALPGEFTFKAYMNGKIDLAQAEAVQELIAARNTSALKVAEEQLAGALSKKILGFQKELVDIAAILEAWVDFPEEGLEFASLEEVTASLQLTQSKMQQLADTFHEGRILHEGLSLCLIGSPNVGKSSLMNALLGKERAIVTEIPGTTRDLLEEDMRLGNLHFRLIDTAGIRETDERIEKEGIRRSLDAMDKADLILLLLDASRSLEPQDLALLAQVPTEKTVLVWNKIDLSTVAFPNVSTAETVKISAKENIGFKDLHAAIDKLVWQKRRPSREEVVITNHRHKQALSQAIATMETLINGLKNGVSPEFLSSDMRKILQELGTIIGTNITEDILSAIFSKFCVGK
jgi:tRNA modification GTPase